MPDNFDRSKITFRRFYPVKFKKRKTIDSVTSENMLEIAIDYYIELPTTLNKIFFNKDFFIDGRENGLGLIAKISSDKETLTIFSRFNAASQNFDFRSVAGRDPVVTDEEKLTLSPTRKEEINSFLDEIVNEVNWNAF